MTTINKLTATDTVVAGDQAAIYKVGNGDTRRAAMSVLLEYMQANLTFTTQGFGAYVTQYAAPSASGWSVTITDGDDDDENVHLILTPTAGTAAGTIVLPPVASLVDKQEILINCTQSVTTLTVDGNGASSVTGDPATLAINDFFRLKYDLPTTVWYRVG